MIKLIKQHKLVVLSILLMISITLYTFFEKNRTELIYSSSKESLKVIEMFEIEEIEEDLPIQIEEEIFKKEIPVYICGEVENAGVYLLEEGSLIDDLLKKAGGATDEADMISVNLAQEVVANSQVYIPNKNETLVQTTTLEDEKIVNISDGKININIATVDELDTLPSIGETRAKAIISYRDENNGFKSLEEVKNVSGIGDKIYEGLVDLIKIE
ncbi:MAG: hypothetical protein ATN36_04095 [Epulopiscium sp. Nele67-Bin005]|nr:MAG: hypothetical protein ATN36_04095 [Epulopiscium sp. Nele67-Bin005]